MKRVYLQICKLLLAMVGVGFAFPADAQIAVVRPDVAAPGMTVVLEVQAKNSLVKYFGPDGFAPQNVSCFTLDPADTNRLRFGPLCISWNGRLLQIPIFVTASGGETGPVPIVIRGRNAYDTIPFSIVLPQTLFNLSGNVALGQGAGGVLSLHNTLVVDQLVANNANLTISTSNASLEPVTILSAGPIVLKNSTISVRASGLNGGPGGGAGGHGYEGEGGAGFTGGGNSGIRTPSGNIGSAVDSLPSDNFGGQSLTGVLGGGSAPDNDQGGGGGTGCPYGSSGAAGLENASSAPGGSGGGSAGGEANQFNVAYGGGGGAFGTDGQPAGGGSVPNNGLHNGGRFLIPLQGGSGGGAGNSEGLRNGAGNGGGGGGAIALIAFDSISLQNSTIRAEGDSGTTGVTNTAGGGGGSGGAVLVATNSQLSTTNFGIQINGGNGGQGGINTSGGAENSGGAGGFGRLRIDGGNPAINIPLASIVSSVISVQKPATLIAGEWMVLSGFASDASNETDSIHIYYRTNRTGWTRLDTVRNRASGRWSKWIPRPFDSLLFVATSIKVNSPSATFANYEPDWAMSHAGLMLLRQPAAPHLISLDTLAFGTERVGQCKTLKVLVTNDGSAPLRIDSIAIGRQQYTVVPSGGFTIEPYTSDTLSVTFCPDSAISIDGLLELFSNDGISRPKRITLAGRGSLKNDSLSIVPSSVRFDRVLVGKCDSAHVIFRSVGADTVNLLASSWSQPPFSLDLQGASKLLAPGDSVIAIVRFCPADSGDPSTGFTVNEHGDKLSVSGRAVIRHLAAVQDTALGSICLGQVFPVSLPVDNQGNDTASILRIDPAGSSITFQSPSLPVTIGTRQQKAFTFELKATGIGDHVDTIQFLAADTALRTILRYHVSAPLLLTDSIFDLGELCAGQTDTMKFPLRNATTDTIAFEIDTAGLAPEFVLQGTDASLASHDSALIRIVFNPTAAGKVTSSIKLVAHANGCDSVYSVSVTGLGSTSVLAAADLTFDTTLVGQCRDDSVLVRNPCGPAQTLDNLAVTAPFQYLDSGLQPITIPAGGEMMLHFRYCPDSVGIQTQSLQLGAIQTVIKGIAKDTTSAWIALTISSTSIRAGETGTTKITLDSSSLPGSHPLHLSLSYDPSVVWLESSTGISGRLISEGVYAFDTTVDLVRRAQSIGSVTWRALIGPRESTSVNLSLTTDTVTTLRVHPGLITITDCYQLGGHLSVSGPYIIHSIRPSVVSADATVTIELGNSARATGEIVDMTGRRLATVFDRDFERGVYEIPLHASSIASGRYMFVLRSLDWRGQMPFIIER